MVHAAVHAAAHTAVRTAAHTARVVLSIAGEVADVSPADLTAIGAAVAAAIGVSAASVAVSCSSDARPLEHEAPAQAPAANKGIPYVLCLPPCAGVAGRY